MAITTQDFTTLVRNSVAAIQGAAKGLVDLTVGSILRAVVEANATVVLWLQGLVLQLLATTRAATSTATDLDSYMLDFGLTRLGAVKASGLVTFSRFTPTAQAVVPVGATVLTTDGLQSFTVTLDTSNPVYNATLGGYVLAAAVSSITVTVGAVNAGIQANASAASITLLNAPVPGVDSVTNAAAFTNGVDAETDAALRVRFVAYIASLSRATKSAIGNAVVALKQGVTYSITENMTYGDVVQPGYFYVVIDDGTGAPGATLLSSASNAIDAVRPVSSTFGVFAPIVINAAVTMTATIAAGYDVTATKALVVTAIRAYINTLTIGQTLAYSRLTQVAYDASPGVTNITTVTLNLGTSDLTANVRSVIKASTVAVA